MNTRKPATHDREIAGDYMMTERRLPAVPDAPSGFVPTTSERSSNPFASRRPHGVGIRLRRRFALQMRQPRPLPPCVARLLVRRQQFHPWTARQCAGRGHRSRTEACRPVEKRDDAVLALRALPNKSSSHLCDALHPRIYFPGFVPLLIMMHPTSRPARGNP